VNNQSPFFLNIAPRTAVLIGLIADRSNSSDSVHLNVAVIYLSIVHDLLIRVTVSAGECVRA